MGHITATQAHNCDTAVNGQIPVWVTLPSGTCTSLHGWCCGPLDAVCSYPEQDPWLKTPQYTCTAM